MNKTDARRIAIETMDIDLPGIEDDLSAGLEPGARSGPSRFRAGRTP